MPNRNLLLTMALTLPLMAGIGAIGYICFALFGGLGWFAGVLFAVLTLALVLPVIRLFSRRVLEPLPRVPIPRQAPSLSSPAPPPPSWQASCTPITSEEGLVTCEHLRPIESALRSAGVVLRHTAGGSPRVVLCECWFHEESLLEQFPLPAGVTYSPYLDHLGDGQQSIDCTACGSSLCVFDPDRPRPRFPPEQVDWWK